MSILKAINEYFLINSANSLSADNCKLTQGFISLLYTLYSAKSIYLNIELDFL